MKKSISFILSLTLVLGISAKAQVQTIVINKAETERIEKYLSSDELEGRKTFSKGIEKAAAFIANEFDQAGLNKFNGNSTYLQNFNLIKPRIVSLSCKIDGAEFDTKQVVVVTIAPTIQINETSGYEIVKINKDENFMAKAYGFLSASNNLIVLVDESFAPNFLRLAQFKNNLSDQQKNIVFILSNNTPANFTIEATHKIELQSLSNVVAMIPGKSLPNEFVIFSGHYDHLGVNGKKAVDGDSIYNGANDDAAGTTAMIMLSKYFAQLNNNARTLLFVAFTAEESGGFGAKHFSKQLDPLSVKAMFNLEMIGTESKWGKNSAYITGYEKTDMGEILQKNLAGTGFQFYPDPYTDQNLFYRSDNATLARLGVPAHTISTSKMDSEPNYHKVSDHFETLDMDNMNEIIKAIALSAQTIISGKDTPSRVNTAQLK
jgi:Zn-dependent M28 family amino/carboxypeptidase